jgi:hypothetical protein
MTEISAVEAFGELITLLKLNHDGVEFRRLISEFVDKGSVLGSIKVNDGSTGGRSAPHLMVGGEPSDGLISTLKAARALDQKRKAFGGGEGHGSHPYDSILPIGSALSRL